MSPRLACLGDSPAVGSSIKRIRNEHERRSTTDPGVRKRSSRFDGVVPVKIHWNSKPKKRAAKSAAVLSEFDKRREEFQRSHCSVRDVDRKRVHNKAIRKGRRKKTGGRPSIPGRPHPDQDKAIGEQLLAAYEEMLSVGDPGTVFVEIVLRAFADCLLGKARCGLRSCSRCESKRVDEDGKKLKRLALQYDRKFIRATTILLPPIPVEPSPRASAVADVLRQGARSLSAAVLNSGIRVGYRFLPDCRVVHASKIASKDYAAKFIESHYPDWRQHDTWLIPHLHGLVFLYEWHRCGDVEKLLRGLFPGTRAVELKQLFRNQTDQEAVYRWTRYCAEQEVSGTGSRGKGERFADLYSPTEIIFIEEIHRLVRDESAFVQWADSDEFDLLPDEPLEVDLEEVLQEIRCGELDSETFSIELERDEYEPDWEIDDDFRDEDCDGDPDNVLIASGSSKRLGLIVSQTENVSRECRSSYGIKSSHYRPRQYGQNRRPRPQSRGPPVRGPPTPSEPPNGEFCSPQRETTTRTDPSAASCRRIVPSKRGTLDRA